MLILWNKRSKVLLQGAVAMDCAIAPSAQALTYGGDTTGQPTWNRPSDSTNPPTALSGRGTAVPYQAQPFTVPTTGLYNVLLTPTLWDSLVVLYQNSFNPLQPLTNALSINDDFPDESRSGFSGFNLVAARQYFLVATGYDNTSFGAYTVSIEQEITPVPLPFSPLPGLVFASSIYLLKRSRA